MKYLTKSYNGNTYITDTETFETEVCRGTQFSKRYNDTYKDFEIDKTIKALTGADVYTYNGYIVYLEGNFNGIELKISDYFRGIYASAFLLDFENIKLKFDNKCKIPKIENMMLNYTKGIVLDCTELNKEDALELYKCCGLCSNFIYNKDIKEEFALSIYNRINYKVIIDEEHIANRIANMLNDKILYVNRNYRVVWNNLALDLLEYFDVDELTQEEIEELKTDYSLAYSFILDNIEIYDSEYKEILFTFFGIRNVVSSELLYNVNELIEEVLLELEQKIDKETE